MDNEAWYSVTPEVIAIQHARGCQGKLVINAFSGVGGNTIQFAKVGAFVIAIDIDPVKLDFARHNAKIYGVENRVEYVLGDFLHLASSLRLRGDYIFLSPLWGGPSYSQYKICTLDMLKPVDGWALIDIAKAIAPNIITFLPRNVDIAQLEDIARFSSLSLEIEENFVRGKLKGITAYFQQQDKEVK